jgi:ABC-type branched-subunit amino acid transport system substrate-binding protein
MLAIPKRRKVRDYYKDDSNFVFHKVALKETLYSLAKQYGVEIEQIMRYNKKELRKGLQAGEVIRIPRQVVEKPGDKKSQTDSAKPKLMAIDTLYPELAKDFKCDTLLLEKTQVPVKIALLLPFMLEENKRYNKPDTTDKDTQQDQYSIYPPTLNFIQFYEGFLLAIDALKKNGLSVELFVFDTEGDSSYVKRILKDKNLEQIDMIIGPVYSYNAKIVGNYAKKKKIPMISVLSNSSEIIENNPYALQVNPSLKTEVKQAVRFIAGIAPKNNVILICNEHIADIDLMDVYEQELLKHFNYEYARVSDTNLIIKEVPYTDSLENYIDDFMSATKKNIIIIPSERETYINELFNKIYPFTIDYKIQFFGLPVWPRFSSIERDYYYDLELLYYTPFYIDFDSKTVIDFIKNYRKYYKTDIDKISSEGYNFALLGYDIGSFFLGAYKKYGKNIVLCIDQFDKKAKQTKFNFKKSNTLNGFENQAISFIKFEDANYSEIKIDPKEFIILEQNKSILDSIDYDY